MAKFTYNNAKNASTGYMPFELNYRYHFQVLYNKDVDPYSQPKSADKLATKLRELMIVYGKNF